MMQALHCRGLSYCYHYKKSELLQQFFCNRCKNRHYMSHIAVFFGTTAIGLVFCDVLQWQDINPSQYICISGINISFCANTIVVIQKTAAICKLQQRWNDCFNRYPFLQRFFLVIGLQRQVGPSQQTFKFPSPKFSLCFFGFPTYQVFTFHFSLIILTLSIRNSHSLQTLNLNSSNSPSSPSSTKPPSAPLPTSPHSALSLSSTKPPSALTPTSPLARPLALRQEHHSDL